MDLDLCLDDSFSADLLIPFLHGHYSTLVHLSDAASALLQYEKEKTGRHFLFREAG